MVKLWGTRATCSVLSQTPQLRTDRGFVFASVSLQFNSKRVDEGHEFPTQQWRNPFVFCFFSRETAKKQWEWEQKTAICTFSFERVALLCDVPAALEHTYWYSEKCIIISRLWLVKLPHACLHLTILLTCYFASEISHVREPRTCIGIIPSSHPFPLPFQIQRAFPARHTNLVWLLKGNFTQKSFKTQQKRCLFTGSE